jgi:ubiquinone/menaquinone biosynthesis C-methylase UbiE
VSGVIPSPNIWDHPSVYELENHGADPDGAIEAAMLAVRPWSGAAVLDLGCGTGYHLARFAASAGSVTGVEPHPPLLRLARRRLASLDPGTAARITLKAGSAQRIPLPDASVDVVHARWAYFFGPGCEPGLAEVRRVLRRGGTAFVIDNDGSRSTFGSWFRRSLPGYDPAAVERFWARQGYTRRSLDIRWEHATRSDFEAVVRIELPPDLADAVLAEHPGTTVDYAVNLFWWTKP